MRLSNKFRRSPYCENLVRIDCNWTNLDEIEIISPAFGGISSEAELYVPKGTKALYESTEPWKSSFKNIIERDDNVTSIESSGYHDIAISASGSNININGLKDGESVSFYSTSGVLLGTTTASAGTATFNATNESIVIVKIGNQSIKVQM